MASADALPHLRRFVRSALPCFVRRLACWKGLQPGQHADVIADLEQDLVLDYLEHRASIDRLPARERHARWFRLLSQRHYQLRLRGQRLLESSCAPDSLADPSTWQCRDAPANDLQRVIEAAFAAGSDRGLAHRLLIDADHLKNGRINTDATALRVGVPPRELRALWQRLADRLGYGPEFVAFWRQRLVEALVGLAADLLRDAGMVRVFEERRRLPPDPAARLRRIRRIKDELSRRPLAPELKSALAHFTKRGASAQLDARTPLACARQLQPDSLAVLHWTFEAAIAHGDLAEAGRALRAIRKHDADGVGVALARSRWIEARGRQRPSLPWRRRALTIIERCRDRYRDLRLEIVRQRLEAQ